MIAEFELKCFLADANIICIWEFMLTILFQMDFHMGGFVQFKDKAKHPAERARSPKWYS